MEQSLALRDIHLPDAINWWPPAMGWWVLMLLIPLLIFGSWWLFKRLTRQTVVKTARSLLEQIKTNPNTNDFEKLHQLSIWLRRVSISIAPHEQSAGLSGEAWLAYLDNGVEGTPFSQGIGQVISSAQYRQSAPDNLDIPALITLCESWLKGHKQ